MATQVNHPWRATARTVFAGVVAVATLAPLIATQVFPDGGPAAVVWIVTVSGLVTRVLAHPAVNEILKKFAPFLLPAPATGEVPAQIDVPAEVPVPEGVADDGADVFGEQGPNAV